MISPCYKCGGTGNYGTLVCSLCEGEGSAPTPAEIRLRERVSHLEAALVGLQEDVRERLRKQKIGAAVLALLALVYYINR